MNFVRKAAFCLNVTIVLHSCVFKDALFLCISFHLRWIYCWVRSNKVNTRKCEILSPFSSYWRQQLLLQKVFLSFCSCWFYWNELKKRIFFYEQ